MPSLSLAPALVMGRKTGKTAMRVLRDHPWASSRVGRPRATGAASRGTASPAHPEFGWLAPFPPSLQGDDALWSPLCSLPQDSKLHPCSISALTSLQGDLTPSSLPTTSLHDAAPDPDLQRFSKLNPRDCFTHETQRTSFSVTWKWGFSLEWNLDLSTLLLRDLISI